MMNWPNFFAMGGYGFFVWGAYGVTFVLMVMEVLLLIGRRKAAAPRAAHIHVECGSVS